MNSLRKRSMSLRVSVDDLRELFDEDEVSDRSEEEDGEICSFLQVNCCFCWSCSRIIDLFSTDLLAIGREQSTVESLEEEASPSDPSLLRSRSLVAAWACFSALLSGFSLTGAGAACSLIWVLSLWDEAEAEEVLLRMLRTVLRTEAPSDECFLTLNGVESSPVDICELWVMFKAVGCN